MSAQHVAFASVIYRDRLEQAMYRDRPTKVRRARGSAPRTRALTDLWVAVSHPFRRQVVGTTS